MGNGPGGALLFTVIFPVLALKPAFPDPALIKASPSLDGGKISLYKTDSKREGAGGDPPAGVLFKKTSFREGVKTDSRPALQANLPRDGGRFYLARSSEKRRARRKDTKKQERRAAGAQKRRKAKRSPAFTSPRNKKSSEGLSVGTVKKGHLLHRLGLRTGDVIKKINDRKVSSKKSFFALLKRSRSGEKNLLKIERKGKQRTLYYIMEIKGGPVFRRTYRAVSRKSGGGLKSARRGKVRGKIAAKRRKNSPSRTLSSKKPGGKGVPKGERKRPPAPTPPGGKGARAGLKKKGGGFPQKQAGDTLNGGGEKPSLPQTGPQAPPSFDKLSKKEKTLLAGKSKYLQKGYVLQMNSKIYRKPNFDAPHIYTVPAGGKVLISRKIFMPPSKFGTFYKIFIHKKKKVVGYISEIDVTPRFERSGKNKINPRYAILKAQMKRGRGPGEEALLQPEKWPEPEPSKPPKKKKGDRFAGLSLLVKWDGKRNLQSFFGGVKFSGQGVLSTALNMDINLMSDMRRENFRFDLLGIYTLLKGRGGGSLYLGGGMEMSLERATGTIFPGLLGSAGLRMTLLTGIFWQNEFRASWTFDLSKKAAEDSYGFLTSLQFRF